MLVYVCVCGESHAFLLLAEHLHFTFTTHIYTIYTSTFILFNTKNNFPWLRTGQCQIVGDMQKWQKLHQLKLLSSFQWQTDRLSVWLDGCYQYLNMAELLLNNQTITTNQMGEGQRSRVNKEREGWIERGRYAV